MNCGNSVHPHPGVREVGRIIDSSESKIDRSDTVESQVMMEHCRVIEDVFKSLKLLRHNAPCFPLVKITHPPHSQKKRLAVS